MYKHMVMIPKGKVWSPQFGEIVIKSSPQYSAILEIYTDKSGVPAESHYWIGDQYDGNCAKIPEKEEK